MLNEKCGEKFLATVDNSDHNPVHLLFDRWRIEAPEDVEQQQLASSSATRPQGVMAFDDPASIQPLMDAIADGWTFGKALPHLMAQPWEEMVDQPLTDVCKRDRLTPSPLAARQSAASPAAAPRPEDDRRSRSRRPSRSVAFVPRSSSVAGQDDR